MKRTTRSYLMGIGTSSLAFTVLLIGLVFYISQYYLPSRDLLLEESLSKSAAVNSETAFRMAMPLKKGQTITSEHLESITVSRDISGEFVFSRSVESAIYAASRDLEKGMILYEDMVYDPSKISPDLRVIEIAEAVMPLTLKKGETVDLRISFPSGLDYVVLSKKQVVEIIKDSESTLENTSVDSTVLTKPRMIIVHLDAEEILRFSSAMVDAFFKPGTYLYVASYVAPEYQANATVNYPSNEEVQRLMLEDPNIVNRAKLALALDQRNFLNNSLSKLSTDTVRPTPKEIEGAKSIETEKPAPSLSDLDN